MSQQLILELSDEVYTNLQHKANAVGLSIAEWIVAKLGQEDILDLSEDRKETARQRFRSHAGSISLGYATKIDNESIDADLARAYADEY